MKKVDLVVPCLNEASCVIPLYEAVEKAFREEEGYTFRILYVNDGSTDGTLEELRQLNRAHPEHADYISFSRNFGKESAIYAGLEQSDGDLVVLMDADLQHPPRLIPEMIRGIEEGHDCVGARRISRHGEPPVRSFFSKMFYRIVKRLTGMEMVQGGSDFRMMTRQMVDAVLQLQERERFTKGILTWVGFDTKWIEYENVERFAGKSKWSFFDLLHYAVNGFVAFAAAPLKAVTWIGGIITAGAFIYGLVTLIAALSGGGARTGYTTIVILILFFGGVLITLVGVVGEYVARIYQELKMRPIFIEKESSLRKRER
ncbi:MAG: glycosyltransferase family 2 protein [Clostridia bacterium]|nr:glycosyltransferase family 2 protein [Clostridia bacterium]MBR6966776.1 glycosyltransferase family 2 protein [Clostridia bacterium]